MGFTGGLRVKPGEVSLAHNGVLFLDELPEFSAQALDSLRQPLENGEVVVARCEGEKENVSRKKWASPRGSATSAGLSNL